MKKSILFLIALTFFTYQTNSQELWGMTLNGGTYDFGTIYKTDLDGSNHTVIHSFQQDYDGTTPVFLNLCEGNNGKLYGMVDTGGLGSWGVLFEYDPSTEIYTKKLDFSYDTVDGKAPFGGLILGSNNKMYGVTRNGGANNNGVIFEYDYINNTYTNLYDFNSSTGGNPTGNLLEVNGKLYGMTSFGASGGGGVLFAYDLEGDSLSILRNLSGASNGKNGYGQLVEAPNGNLYGLTNTGGTNDFGVVFEYNISTTTFTKKIDLDGTTTGKNPYGGLILGPDAKLYGLTHSGGANGVGVLFKYDQDTNTLTNKFDFTTSSGGNPWGTMTLADNGKIYGNTFSTIFEYNSATNTFLKKQDLVSNDTGSNALGSLFFASNGKIYGGTSRGGVSNEGVINEYDIALNTLTKVHDFDGIHKGDHPYGGLLLANNGKLYGMTYDSNPVSGHLFEIDPITEEITSLHKFTSSTGKLPRGNLIQAADGLLYGLTYSGGTGNSGVIFNYNIDTATYTKLGDFSSISELTSTNLGRLPYGSLVEAANGNLYGMSYTGGLSNLGTIVQYRMFDGNFSRIASFSTATGTRPRGSLILAEDNYLYGMAREGGANGFGTLFKYFPGQSSVTVLVDFGGTEGSRTASNGKFPLGDLIETSDGKLYGMTSSGGDNDFGILFEYDPINDIYTKKIDFDGVNNGSFPSGSLSQSSNGKLIGVTSTGGVNDLGVLFEYDPATNTLTKKLDFDGTNGQNPQSGGGTDISSILGVDDFELKFNFLLYPNPSNKKITVTLKSSASYSLVSMLGQEIQKGTFNFGDNTLDISHLAKGLYLLNVKSSQGTATKKIIKQ